MKKFEALLEKSLSKLDKIKNNCRSVIVVFLYFVQARLIWLEYVNEQEPSTNLDFETLCLVGKGVTLDTGGLDIKTGGAMFGMSRDKYGSAVVAGFFAVLDALKPKGIKVRACMCMVRNSVDAASYSCDEIITVTLVGF